MELHAPVDKQTITNDFLQYTMMALASEEAGIGRRAGIGTKISLMLMIKTLVSQGVDPEEALNRTLRVALANWMVAQISSRYRDANLPDDVAALTVDVALDICHDLPLEEGPEKAKSMLGGMVHTVVDLATKRAKEGYQKTEANCAPIEVHVMADDD